MNKTDYLTILDEKLQVLPHKERYDILGDYVDHFRSGIAQGRTEEEIAASLGDPYWIADDLIRQYAPPPPPMPERPPFSLFRALWMTCVMGLFNVIFVLGPYIAVAGTLVGLWAAAFGLGFSGIAAIGIMLFSTVSNAFRYMMDSGLSLVTLTAGSVLVSSMGILLGIGCWYMSKGFLRLTARYISWNFKTIIGRRY